MWKTVSPQCRNLSYVPCETEQTPALQWVYQRKAEAKKDLAENRLGQNEELRGNTSWTGKDPLTQIWTT